MSVRAAIEAFPLDAGDIVMLNDPFRGGTHLPDITLVMPLYVEQTRAKRPDFYVASRAHHADVGGAYPGSMGLCREIYQEGLRIPPVKIFSGGKMQQDILNLLLNNVRTPEEREGDLGAQISACHTGAMRLREICGRYGTQRVKRAAGELLKYSEKLMRDFLTKVPPGSYSAEDFLDDDGITGGPVKIAVTINFTHRNGKARLRNDLVIVDFRGSGPQAHGSINAVEAITYSACFYVFRCLLAEDVPATAGLMRPLRISVPAGTVVNARPPAAVAGGNVETSQRIVDVLQRALAQAIPETIPAAASGTMNNLTIGGIDPRTGSEFSYYETVAGGMGARPMLAGMSATHTHMTNSLNTPAEALEYAYPLRVREYRIRQDSGGKGKHNGGDGAVREIETLVAARMSLLADRRKRAPYGLRGGKDGERGRAFIIRLDGSREELTSKGSWALAAGDRVRIETPSGGGFGK